MAPTQYSENAATVVKVFDNYKYSPPPTPPPAGMCVKLR